MRRVRVLPLHYRCIGGHECVLQEGMGVRLHANPVMISLIKLKQTVVNYQLNACL
jgi:hypothetical protein